MGNIANQRIWKYAIPWKGIVKIIKGGKILSVGMQASGAQMWILVDPMGEGGKTEERYFQIIATGELFDKRNMYFLGIVFEDALAWHIFEKKERGR